MRAKVVAIVVGLVCVTVIAGCNKKVAPATHYHVTVHPPVPPDTQCTLTGAPDPIPLNQKNKDDVDWTLGGHTSDTYTIKFNKDANEQSPCDGNPPLSMQGSGPPVKCTVQNIAIPSGQHKNFPYRISKEGGPDCVDPSVDVQN